MQTQQQYSGIDFTPSASNAVPSGIDFTPTMSPDQSAQVLGHSTGVLKNGLSVGGVGIGLAKSAVSTLQSANVLDTMKGMANQPQLKDITGVDPNQAIQPKNQSEQVGDILGTGAQMILPAMAGTKVLEESKTANTIYDKISKPLTDFLENRKLNKTIAAVAPKLTAGEMEASPNVVRPRFGAPSVDFTKDKGLQAIANDSQGIVKGKSAIDDKNALRSAIETTSEKQIKPFLAQNKVPANFEDLQKKLDLVHPQSSLKADPNAIKTYSRVREEVQQSLYNSLKQTAKEKGDFSGKVDFNDVWDARKVLDSKAEEELGSKVFGTPEFTGAKAAIQDMRQGLTQYIKDSLQFPGKMEDVNKLQEFVQVARSRGIEIGGKEAQGLMQQMGIKSSPEDIARAKTFENAMGKISNYYKAMDNVSTKIPDEIRSNATFGKRHPLIKRAAGGAATVVGGGAAYEIGKEAGVPLP